MRLNEGGFNYQEFADSKQIVLDVRCRDSEGRYFNVEMQVAIYAGLIQRLVYYVCSMHCDQLSKYNLPEETISEASNLEKWAFLLLRAQDYDAATLKQLLPGIEFQTAIETIEIISAKTEDKQMYEADVRSTRKSSTGL